MGGWAVRNRKKMQLRLLRHPQYLGHLGGWLIETESLVGQQGALGPLLFLNEHALNKSTSLQPWTLSQRDISPSLCSTTTWVSAGKRGMGKRGTKTRADQRENFALNMSVRFLNERSKIFKTKSDKNLRTGLICL